MNTVYKGAFVLICLLVATSYGEDNNNVELPNTAKCKCVADFFEAFDAPDDEILRDYLENNVKADVTEGLSMEQRLARLLSFKKIAASITIKKLLSIEENKIRICVQDGSDNYYEIMFEFVGGKTDKVTAIRIMPVEAANIADLSGPSLSENDVINNVENYLKDAAENDLFSGVVLIAHDDKILFHHAYGLASREYDAPNLVDTRFNLGSINKLFTRIAIGQLCEKGALSLDDTLGKFLPEYPNREAASKVTVNQLLDMMSGIGDFFTQKYFETPKYRIRNLEDYLPLFAEDTLLFEPGTNRAYSNGGYLILGLIVARVSGMSYFEYVRKNIYEPAGMVATGHLNADFIEKNVASGYTQSVEEITSGIDDESKQELYSNIYTRPARGSSAGGGYSTAGDLFRFAVALRQGKLLGDLKEEWFRGTMAVAGGAPGINAELDIDLIPGWTVVVLANGDPPMAKAVAQKINIWLRRME